MNRRLKQWRASIRISGPARRLWAVPVGLALLSASPTPALAADPPAKAEEVDPGTKKLTAAHGLFQRSLFKLAAQEYAEFLGQYPQHAQVTTAKYALAVSRYRLGEHEPAVKLLGEVLQDAKFEQRDEALAVLGHSQLAGNQYDKALAAFDELLAKHPQSKHAEVAALNRAQVLYLADKKPDALAAADAFVKKYPQSPERPAAFYFLALSQNDLGKSDDAAKTLAQLLEAHPDSRYQLDATLLLGQCLEAAGKLEPAAEQYRKVIATAPAARKADGYYSLGVVLYKAAKYDESIKQLTSLLTEQPTSPYAAPAKLQLGLVQLAAGKIGEARGTLNEVAAKDTARANDAKYGLAQCDIAEKKFDAARAVLDPLAQAQPAPANLAQIMLDRAVCLAETGKHEQAAAEFERVRGRFIQSPQAPEATYRQAFSLHKLGKFEQSRALSKQIAELKDSDMAGPAAELDAENLFLMGQYEDAAEAFSALASTSKDPQRQSQFALRRGQCAYFAGDYPGAVKLLQPLAADPKVAQAEELHPAVFLLGDALLQQGKHAEAAAALQQFISFGKGDSREALYKLALAQLRAENKAAADQTLAQLTSGPADSPWVTRGLFERGQLLYKDAKPDQAAPALAKVLSSNAPEELAAPATYLLGWIDFEAKRYPEAAAKWAQVSEKYPKHALAPDAAFQRGAALREAGKHEEALAALGGYVTSQPKGQHVAKAKQLAAASLTALKRDDQAAAMLAALASDSQAATDTVLYDLAWSQRALKDDKAATDAYRRLLKQHPQSKLAPAARAELAEFLYAEKKYAEAAELLEAVVGDEKAEEKTLAAAGYRLGWCYEKLEQPAKAAAAFSAFARKNGKDELAASALLQAGLAFAADGKFGESAESLSSMLKSFPQHNQASIALLKLGEVQAEANDFEASLQSFTSFLQKHPADPFAYRAQFGLGWAQENRKQYDEARKSYQKVIASHNGETAARAQFQTGETYLAEGKFEQAVPALLAVEDVYAYPQWSARALLEAGRAFEQLKQSDQAQQQYAQVVSKYKDTPEAGLAQERLKVIKG